MANILIIEDEHGISGLIKRSLDLTGHHSFQAYTGREAVLCVEKEKIDLILLDINLPDTDGFKLKKELRDIPVIFVSARDGITDKVKGLGSGAEDYVVKPFHIQELIARVQLVLKRHQKEETNIFLGKLYINMEERKTEREGISIELTNQEWELLKTLIINKNIALSRDKLLELAWGMDFEGDIRTVDVHIQRLRKKLGLEKEIKTIFRYGYRLEVEL